MSYASLFAAPARVWAATHKNVLHHLATTCGTMAVVWMGALTWSKVPVPWMQSNASSPLLALQVWWLNAVLLGLVALVLKSVPSTATDAKARPDKVVTAAVMLGAAVCAMFALMWGVDQMARSSANALLADYTALTREAPLVATSPTDADFDGQGHLVPQVKAERCARAAMGMDLFQAQHLNTPQDPLLGLAAIAYQGLNTRAVKAGCIDASAWHQHTQQVQALVSQAQHTPQVEDALWVGAWGGQAHQSVLAQAQEVLARPLP